MKISKRLLISCLVILFSICTVYSQENSNNLKVEFSYGISINDVYQHDYNINFKKRISLILFGLKMKKELTKRTQINLEFEYSHKRPDNHVIDYFSISPMYEVKMFDNHFRIELGPYFSYLNEYKVNKIESNHEELKDIDFGGQLGIGKRIRFKEKVFYISSQMELGLYKFSFSKHQIFQFKVSYEI